MACSTEQKQHWDTHGFLILPEVYNDATLAEIEDVNRQFWRRLPYDVVVDDLPNRRRTVAALLPKEALGGRFKVNDLYLTEPRLRSCILDPGIVPILTELLGDVPALCNTLSLNYGTEQPLHVDSLYMPPPTPSRLVATWTALEDVRPDAGPLVYYPGSHVIPPYKFSNGGYLEIAAERPLWRAYLCEWVKRLNLRPMLFLPKKGDVLIWHAELLHGGSTLADPRRTRASLVSHFFSATDAKAKYQRVESLGGACWIDRDPQPLSAQETALLRAYLAREAKRFREPAAVTAT